MNKVRSTNISKANQHQSGQSTSIMLIVQVRSFRGSQVIQQQSAHSVAARSFSCSQVIQRQSGHLARSFSSSQAIQWQSAHSVAVRSFSNSQVSHYRSVHSASTGPSSIKLKNGFVTNIICIPVHLFRHAIVCFFVQVYNYISFLSFFHFTHLMLLVPFSVYHALVLCALTKKAQHIICTVEQPLTNNHPDERPP